MITGITTGRSGSIVDVSGVDVDEALARPRRSQLHGPQLVATDFIRACPADIVVEKVEKLRALSPLYEMAQEGIDLKSIEWAAH